MTPVEFLEILHVAERLKDTPRHCTTTNRRTESVAEHSWRVSLMAFLLKGEFPEADMDKVVKMCLIHDLGECFTGDIPTFIKTDGDRAVEDSLNRTPCTYIPREAVAACLGGVRSGDIVCFVSAVEGLDISHVGFVLVEDGRCVAKDVVARFDVGLLVLASGVDDAPAA